MNILIINSGIFEQKIINLCLKSKLLDKIYTASEEPLEDIPNIEYKDLNELAWKAKALQIDIAIIADKTLIKAGIVEIFKKKLLNIIAVNPKWYNLENSRLVAKQLMNYYSINNPSVIKVPLTFPVIIKTKNSLAVEIANSMQELVDIKEKLIEQETFLEEYLNGKVFYLLSLWDGKNLLSFPIDEILTEVQEDRLDLIKTRLNIMFSEEKADFISFITTELIWTKNDWYVLDFKMRLCENSNIENIKTDFLYILNSAIYQKLNELKL
ncbi:hypothetical protein J6R97_05330 [bacterium]|nr:hypothetical protein [bacterium]